MKDIYISARFLTQPVTGVQRYGIELSKAIKRMNEKKYKYNIRFLAPKNIIHHNIANYLEVKTIGRLKGQLWDQISLLWFLKSNRNSLIINFSNTLPIFYRNKIVTIHDIIHLKFPVSYSYRKYYKIVFPLMLKYSKQIITVSEFSKREIANYYGINEEKISVIYNGVSEKFKPRKTHTMEKYILGVSSIACHKNFINLIKAYQKLKTKNIKLYIVGGLNDKIFGKDSRRIIESVKGNENIKFLGRVTDDELIELYSNALCFVYPSVYEGFGIPPLEAQACGCPVIISDIPVFKEIYGDSAVYFNPLDPKDIADKVNQVLNDKKLREQLLIKSLENSKKYTWEKSAEKFFKIINKVMHR